MFQLFYSTLQATIPLHKITTKVKVKVLSLSSQLLIDIYNRLRHNNLYPFTSRTYIYPALTNLAYSFHSSWLATACWLCWKKRCLCLILAACKELSITSLTERLRGVTTGKFSKSRSRRSTNKDKVSNDKQKY